MVGTVSIAEENPDQPAVIALLEASEAYMADLYPSESNHGLSLSDLLDPSVTFLVARLNGKPVGTAAFVAKDGYAEVKRMYVADAARGSKLGKRLLKTVEELAAAKRLTVLRLETGISQPEALGLYRKAGFIEIEPFGAYNPDPLSVFMEKHLDRVGSGG